MLEGSQLCSTHPSSGVGGYRERELVRILATPTIMQGTYILCYCVELVSELILTGVGFDPFTLHILECKTVLAEAIRRADDFIAYIWF